MAAPALEADWFPSLRLEAVFSRVSKKNDTPKPGNLLSVDSVDVFLQQFDQLSLMQEQYEVSQECCNMCSPCSVLCPR